MLTEAFTDLAHSGRSCELNEHQNVLKFENDLQNNSAIRYHIDAKMSGMPSKFPNRILINSTICSVLVLVSSNL